MYLDAIAPHDYQIESVQVKLEACAVDNALGNSYAQCLLFGKSLPISYNVFVSQLQSTTATDKNLIKVSRALTHLKSVYVTLRKGPADAVTRKFCHDFLSTVQSDNKDAVTHNSDVEFKFQLQTGCRLSPEYLSCSHSEAYYQLCESLGVQASALCNFDIAARGYRSNKFSLGTDCEKVLNVDFAGLDTRAGDLTTAQLRL